MRRVLIWLGIILLLLAGGLYLAVRLTPWPGVFLIQYMFSRGDQSVQSSLRPLIPPGIVSRTDITYGPGPDERFDISMPGEAAGPLPVIVWVHGGAWIAGTKEGVTDYLKILAAEGFATVAVEYSTGWGSTYPNPVLQVNAALNHISENAASFGIDPERIILAGDSAGAQIAAQVALLISDTEYAAQLTIQPGIDADQLRGVILASGAYDLQGIDTEGEWSWFTNTVLWAYTGTRNFIGDPLFELASVQQHVTAAFPPTYITSGNADPLEPQARRLEAKLSQLGVSVTSLFFEPQHAPPLQHEFQFLLDLPEARQAFEGMVNFAHGVFFETR